MQYFFFEKKNITKSYHNRSNKSAKNITVMIKELKTHK